jgi:hypothetical protein
MARSNSAKVPGRTNRRSACQSASSLDCSRGIATSLLSAGRLVIMKSDRRAPVAVADWAALPLKSAGSREREFVNASSAQRPNFCAFVCTCATTRVCAARGVNRPPELQVPESSKALTYPVGRTVLIRGENRHDSGLSRGENRLNY